MNEVYWQMFCRNVGIFTLEEQEKLRRSTVAIAGIGGVGGLLAERLLRLGVGHLRISDPGSFEISNHNRQFGSDMTSLDKNKAETVYKGIKDINPEADIIYDNQGITSQADADKLVDGSDVVIDEMDYGAWKESIYLQRAARQRGLFYLFSGAIGFGALLTNFDPQGMSLEEYNGLPPWAGLDAMEEITVAPEKILPVVPSYAGAAMDGQMMQQILAGQKPIPTCSIGVGLAAILAASEAVNILLQRQPVVTAPQYIYFDLLDRKSLVGNIT